MYLINIKSLKKELINGPFTEKQAFQYLLAYLLFSNLVSLLPDTTVNHWTIISGILYVIITFLGIIYCFKKNKGSTGESFLPRYFSLLWVVSLRMFFIWAIPSILGVLVIAQLRGTAQNGATWYSCLFGGIFVIILYWRVGIHIGEVAQAK